MVLQNRLDYGFNGYQVPRAARSARRRGSYRKKIQDSRQCAIDLLATVAGKLLLEGENFLTAGKKSTGKDQCEILQSSVRKEESNKENSQKINLCDRLNVHNQSSSLKECTHAFSGHASVITTFDCSQRFASAAVFGESKSVGGNSARIEVGLSRYGHQNLKDMPNHHLRAVPLKTESIVAGNGAVQCSTDDPVVFNGKPSALVSSDSSAKKPIFGDSVPSPFRNFREAVNLVSCSRDDDENSSGCTQPSTTRMAYRSPMRITDRRVRKLLASKYWNQPQKQNDGELSNIGRKLNAGYSNSNTCYTRQRSQASFPIKIKKHLDYSSVSSSDGGTCREGLPNSSRMGINRDVSGYHAEMLGATGTSLIGAQHTSSSRDSHVKLRIKSFRVPELFIDIPETATIGSLKRSVMKAVNALLRGGLHVGVVLRGKKVRDDNKTLIQTGISQDNKLDSLGFALEPNPLKAPKSLGPEGHLCLMPSDKSQPLIRYLPSTNIVHQATIDSDPPLTNLGNLMESDHGSAPSPTDASMEKSAADSQALVAVPVHHKSNRVEIVQRRIRRPFSVSEVEALVQAVEKLGTGRWRDVKVGAFENAKHRTYVDLKDKWKTLVHTARISPQQRRGETVPQDLLDRVLAAHAYWSKRQSKQHLKQEQQQLSPQPPP